METPTLRGRHVVLEPLVPAHAAELEGAVAPGDDVWTHLPAAPRTVAEMEAWIHARLTPKPGLANEAWLQRHPVSGAAMGSTSLFDIDLAAQSAEIGWTWIAAPYRRTGVNTEAKLLLLTHSFETLGLRRVQLVTDERNDRSRNAILRIGATFEGILRNVRRRRDGSLRNSAFFSITDDEWPRVKGALAAKLRPSTVPSVFHA